MRRAKATSLFASLTLLTAAAQLLADDEIVGAVQSFEQAAVVEENAVVDSRPLSPRARQFMEEQRQREMEECEEISAGDSLDVSYLLDLEFPTRKEAPIAGLMIPIKTQQADYQKEIAGLMIPIKTQQADYQKEIAGLMIPIKTQQADYQKEIAGLMIPIKTQQADYQKEIAGLMIPIKTQQAEYQKEIPGLMIPIKTQQADYQKEIAGLMIPIKTRTFHDLLSEELMGTAASFNSQVFHWIERIPQENVIKLEDGSEWIFERDDASLVRTWRPNDAVVITPKSNWLWGSNYAYVLTNKNLGTSVNVNPFLGPIKFGPYSTWIVGIDFNSNRVYLLNGQGDRSVWEISSADRYLFKEWKINDLVVVGENTSWLTWFSGHNCILFNVDMNHHVRCETVSSTPFARPAPGA